MLVCFISSSIGDPNSTSLLWFLWGLNRLIYETYLKYCRTDIKQFLKNTSHCFQEWTSYLWPLWRYSWKICISLPLHDTAQGPTEYMLCPEFCSCQDPVPKLCWLHIHQSVESLLCVMMNYGQNQLLITHAKQKRRLSTSFCKVNTSSIT